MNVGGDDTTKNESTGPEQGPLNTPPPEREPANVAVPALSQSPVPSPKSPLLTSGRLAVALGVSDQCIRNWHAGGMKAADRDVRGFPLFEVEACRRWRSAFRPTTGQGGARPGQGRKPKAETVPPMFHVEHGSNGAVGSEQNEKLSARDLRRLVADPTGGSYSLLHGKAAKEQFLAVKAATEVANLRGELIDREEAIEAWGKQLGVFSRSLDGMPPRAAPRIVHAAAVIYAEGNLALGAGELSRRLQAAVLEILIDEARMVRGDIVGDPLNAGAAVGIAA